MNDNHDQNWIFLVTFSPNIKWENFGLGEFSLSEGFVHLLGDIDQFNRRYFLVGFRSSELIKKDEAADMARQILRYFLGFIRLAEGGLTIRYVLHDNSETTEEVIGQIEDLNQGEGSVEQFFDDPDLVAPRDHEPRVVYSADRFATGFLHRLQPLMFKFLNDDRIAEEKKTKVKMVLELNHNSDLAGTRRQRFLSEYSALELLVKGLGRREDTEKSITDAIDELRNNGIIEEQEADRLETYLQGLHDIRSDVYFRAKEPLGSDDLPNQLQEIIAMPRTVIDRMLFYYMKFWGKRAEKREQSDN